MEKDVKIFDLIEKEHQRQRGEAIFPALQVKQRTRRNVQQFGNLLLRISMFGAEVEQSVFKQLL